MMQYENPDSPFNSSLYHTGKVCVERDCDKPAGTWWSPFWCWEHNAKRMSKITEGFKEVSLSLKNREIDTEAKTATVCEAK